MYQLLFIAALFIIFILAMSFEFLLFPSGVVLGLGAASIILGIAIIPYGNIRKGSGSAGKGEGESGIPAGKNPRRSTACQSVVVGSFYLFIGIGMFLLQAIGYFH